MGSLKPTRKRGGQKQRRSREHAILARRAKVAEMYLAKLTMAQIGAALGVTKQTVSRDVEAIERELIAQATEKLSLKRAQQAAELQRVITEAWDAWRESREPAKKTSTERELGGLDKDGKPIVVSSKIHVEEVHRTGDHRLLERIIRAVHEESEILGTRSPKKVAATDPTGDNPAESDHVTIVIGGDDDGT